VYNRINIVSSFINIYLLKEFNITTNSKRTELDEKVVKHWHSHEEYTNNKKA